MTLDADEFLRRFLQHLLPRRFLRIRSFGFLANRQRTASMALCCQLLAVADVPVPEAKTRETAWRCPHCGRGQLFRGVFRMMPRCQECGLSYFPEQGYYVGAMIINYIVTTACVVAIFLLSLLIPDFTSLTTNEKILVTNNPEV